MEDKINEVEAANETLSWSIVGMSVALLILIAIVCSLRSELNKLHETVNEMELSAIGE